MKTIYKIVLLITILFVALVLIINQEDLEYYNDSIPIPPVPDTVKNTFTLYFIKNGRLVPENRTIFTENLKYEKNIAEELIKGPRNQTLNQVLPRETKILSIDTIDNTCYINFSNHLTNNEQWENQDKSLIIGALVNSLTQLQHINRVQILVEGEKLHISKEDNSLNQPFKPNLELIEDKEITPYDYIAEFQKNILIGFYDKAYDMLSEESQKEISFEDFENMMAEYIYKLYNYEINLYNTQKYSDHIIVTITYSYNGNEPQKYKQSYVEDWKIVDANGELKIMLKK